MTGRSPFSAPPQRTGRRTSINVDALLDVVEDLFDTLDLPGVHLSLLDSFSANPILSVEEDECRVRVSTAELACDMERARVRNTPPDLHKAVRRWIDHRPVPDAVASEYGVAALNWTDDLKRDIGWQVSVRRNESLIRWQPSVVCDPADRFLIQAAATTRSRSLATHCTLSDRIAVWTSGTLPLLASAPLANLDEALATLRDRRLRVPTTDLYVVVSPPNPVAVGSRQNATRMTEESAEPNVTVPWNRLANLKWI